MKIEEKLRRLTQEYLIGRMPDVEEARKVLSETVPKLTQAELEVRRLKGEIRELMIGKQRRFRRGTPTDILREIRVAVEFDESCRSLGVDPTAFEGLTDDQAKRYVEDLRKTWARIYHSNGEFSDRMKQINNAADFLGDPQNRI